jgi:hypothetical protein
VQDVTVTSQPDPEINMMDDDERALWAEVGPVSSLFIFMKTH